MGTFFFLWALVLPIALICFGAKEAGGKMLSPRKSEPDLHSSDYHWNNDLVRSSDKNNVVDFVFVYYDNTYFVRIKNDRLGITKEYEDKDKYKIQRMVQAQFDEWARM